MTSICTSIGERIRAACGAAVQGFLAAVLSTCGSGALAQDTRVVPKTGQQIPGPSCLDLPGVRDGGYKPCTQADYAAWLTDITRWREERRIRVGYEDGRYRSPALHWAQSSFIQPQAMVYERTLYDPVSNHYTVGRYLEDLKTRYGGVDSVLLWPTYPNLGVDDRNQQEMIASMPGGLDGVRELVADFHKAGVRVFFPMTLWDQGTHEPARPWSEAIAGLMKKVDADGVNGDTQDGVPLAFSQAAETIDHPLVFEPEQSPSDEALAWNVMTWGQYSFPFVPQIDRFKWLEPRHMVNISGRWRRDKTDDLQYAFFNGVGWESWENVWGIWNGISARDGEATRRVATIERGIAPFLVSKDWQPFFPTLLYGVYSSRWPLADATVFTLINRNAYEVTGEQIALPYSPTTRYYDLYHGVELQPRIVGDTAYLSFALEDRGFGAIAVLSTPSAVSRYQPAIDCLMKIMTSLAAKPLSSFDTVWHSLPQHMLAEPSSKPASLSRVPTGMILIPANPAFFFEVHGVEIEGSNDAGVDVQYAWESEARRFHRHLLSIHTFYIDRYPVTNADFQRFLQESHYKPADSLNFLRDWSHGHYPDGGANRPVTWVSHEDAEAYARWAGKRLPHEWEWQYAAQGNEARAFPWGNAWKQNAVPIPQKGRSLSHPDDVAAHPAGASPFGVEDMVGNLWQWTDVFEDEHTRAAVLRGGSFYQPQGSIWYFPQAYRNDEHGKLLLMSTSMDRAATIGFRCVSDVAP